jgi:hypothetical protein
LTRLRLKGDYHHNMNMLETGEGELVVVRWPGQDVRCNAEDFLPCEFCLGFMRRRDLWKHQLACEFKSKTLPSTAARNSRFNERQNCW